MGAEGVIYIGRVCSKFWDQLNLTIYWEGRRKCISGATSLVAALCLEFIYKMTPGFPCHGISGHKFSDSSAFQVCLRIIWSMVIHQKAVKAGFLYAFTDLSIGLGKYLALCRTSGVQLEAEKDER